MDYTEYNKVVIDIALKQWCEAFFRPRLAQVLRAVGERIKDKINQAFSPVSSKGNDQYPIWTGNLRDSMGVALFVEGKMQMFAPPVIANNPQTNESHQQIWGRAELNKLANHTTSRFSKGIWLVMYAGVEYAEKIELFGSDAETPRGKSFFAEFEQMLRNEVMATLDTLRPF